MLAGVLDDAERSYALARAMRTYDISADRARTILADALFEVMRVIWWLPDRAVELARPANRLARARLRARLAARFFFREPDWVMNDFFRKHDEAAFCVDVMCAQDDRISALRGLRHVRTSTLAGGGTVCDSRLYVRS